MPHETPAPSKDKEDFIANEEKLKNLGGKNIADMSDDEAEAFLAERKKLKADNEELYGKAQEEATAENEMRDTYDRAHQENNELDAAKAKAEEAASLKAEADARAKQAEQDQAARQQEIDEATALAERIKGGNVGAEAPGTLKAEDEKSGKDLESAGENLGEKLIEERLEIPKTEMFEKYVDEMPVEGTYMDNYLDKIPGELLANEKFLLRVAEVNPASAYSKASEDLKHSKDFIIKIMQAQPGPGAGGINYHRVNFYDLERMAPELLKDKDIAKVLLGRDDGGEYSSMRAELLNDDEIYELASQRVIAELVKFAKDGREGYPGHTTFKLRDGDRVGGERWNFVKDEKFAKRVIDEIGKLGNVNVSIKDGEVYMEQKGK